MAFAFDNLIRACASCRCCLKQASDEWLHLVRLTTAPDGDANVLPDVTSQADKLPAATLRTANPTAIPNLRIWIFPRCGKIGPQARVQSKWV
jgi:hypothetical protein